MSNSKPVLDVTVTSKAASWPVAGHEWAVRLLQRTTLPVGEGPRHAYLLVGSPQIGKTTLAKAFAQALLCTDPAVRPCGRCRSCRLMGKGGHPDFRLVPPTDRSGDPDRVNGLLRVEQAAEIIHDALLHPVEGRYKVFLIQDVHRANDSFSNKLLKTLEEPPDHVVLCLTAHDRSDLLPTIVSRCQILELRPLDRQTIEQALVTQWQADPARAALLARLANGRLGWAADQLKSPNEGAQRLDDLQQLWRLSRADRVERLAFSAELSSNRDDRRLFALLALWTSWWRDVMLAQAGCLDAVNNLDQQEAIQEDARQFDPTAVRQFLNELGRVEGYLRHTVNTGMALDVLLLKLPRPVR